jgi:hypothetical protein
VVQASRLHRRTARHAPSRPSIRALAAAALFLALALVGSSSATGAELLDGEFDDINLGRQLIEPERFPTLAELRRLVDKPEITSVLMFKLFGSGDNHHLPIWSGDGRRLAFQRSDAGAQASKLLLFSSLSEQRPALLTDRADVYDYMFRWGMNSLAGYAFARIDPRRETTQIYHSSDGRKPEARTSGTARHVFPALYRRTDGIWRLVYEQEGRLIHEAYNEAGPVDGPLTLLRGTAARWSRDGYRLLLAQERFRRGKLVTYDIVVRNLRSETSLPLPAGQEGIVRSPVWAPDERHAAFYVRAPGEDQPWRIRICPVVEDGGGITVGASVVVNHDFQSEGPAWEPTGRRVWFFSHEHHRQAYHPLVAADAQSGETFLVDYPRRCTTPNDLALNPATAVPEMAFVAHDGLPQDLFILFLNHY